MSSYRKRIENSKHLKVIQLALECNRKILKESDEGQQSYKLCDC